VGQYWPGSEIDIGAWVDGNEVTATWAVCDTVIYNDCHIAMDSKEPIDRQTNPYPYAMGTHQESHYKSPDVQ
jgi:hypothetical protein